MSYKIFLLSFLVLAFGACNTLKKPQKSNGKIGNVVLTEGTAINTSADNQDQIIFKGTNNTLIIEYLNAFFNSKSSRDVLIIEGNNNVYRMKQTNIVDESLNSTDTIILKGDNNVVELLNEYFKDTTNLSNGNKIITYKKDYVIREEATEKEPLKKLLFEDIEIENRVTSKLMKAEDVHDHYIQKMIEGDTLAAYYLVQMFSQGIGTESNVKKAVYYYQIAAKKGNLKSQSELGFIYEQDWALVPQNIEMAIYWYKKAALQGDLYSIERLSTLVK